MVGDEEVWTSDVRYQASVSPAGPRGRPLPGIPGHVNTVLGGSASKGASRPPRAFEFQGPVENFQRQPWGTLIKGAGITPATGRLEKASAPSFTFALQS